MNYPEDARPAENADTTEEQHLVLDGTANLDYSEDDQVPRIKGLVELLSQFLGNRRDRES